MMMMMTINNNGNKQMYIERILPIVIQGVERLHCASSLKCVSLLLVLSEGAEEDLIENGILRMFSRVEYNQEKCTDYYRFRYWCILNCLGNVAAGGEKGVERVLESEIWREISMIMKDAVLQYGLIPEMVYLVGNLIDSASKDQVL